MEWFLKVVKDNYANFKGRARRKEYWMFGLFSILFSIAAIIVDFIVGTYFVIYMLYMLALIIPSLAVLVRRLHDVGKSGGWFFISLIPLIGGIWLLVLLCTDGNPGENNYGPSPKAA
ncbi:MAG: DUF805 domain-containing protein [Ignavibacteriaceae bacterium]|jgi:uncharacterized membrane protein YhaH (DUF805 family)|nr:DUF805 domain-containing protein [Ignavibacteriaceae bacterium]